MSGALHADFLPGGGSSISNAAFLFDSTGAWRNAPIYAKHYLVPVVEHVPFVPVSWFRHVPWLSRWSGGFKKGTPFPLYHTAIVPFSVPPSSPSPSKPLPRSYH